MKNMTLLILFTFHFSFLTFNSFAQSCLPEGITFTTQAEIDSFQINYPNCTEIEGFVAISGDDIMNLSGLSVVTAIGGDLRITKNDSLTSFSGLDNLITIEEDLIFYSNNALINLQGLENLITIGANLMIGSWYNAWWPPGNGSLVSLEGLNNLTNIGGRIEICTNYSLTSLETLMNLTTIGGSIVISSNASLTSLTGLDNIVADSIKGLTILGNTLLAICETQSICDYLSDPGGEVTIFNNAPGCNNPSEIANICGFIMPCLPYGNYYFHNQSDIDNFKTNYQDCTILNGDVGISGNDITNLYGLSDVTSIGHLVISDNPMLVNLGLNSLTSVTGLGGISIEYNPSLTSLAGLESLTSIGGQLVIHENEALTSLAGLENLAVIEKFLSIQRNDNLSSLMGLDNVDSNSITHLYIEHNDLLSNCAIKSICNYLASPHGNIRIEDNDPGCNSSEEVESACDSASSVVELTPLEDFILSPNPSSGATLLRYVICDIGYVTCDLFSISGKKIRRLLNEEMMPGEYEMEVDLTGLPAGVYFIRFVAGNQIIMKKIIVKK